jgi:hypothetical protein
MLSGISKVIKAAGDEDFALGMAGTRGKEGRGVPGNS